MKAQVLMIGALVLAGGCKAKDRAADPPATGSGSATPAGGVITLKAGFATPESVLYDDASDRYLVSNINGPETEADDNGYIATVTPDGEVATWIDGAAADVKLDAPKGMAISGDVLWVADISVMRRFDAKSGKQQEDVKIDGATFLNDVVADGEGGVYVTDTGLDAKFEAAGTDAVYRIGKDGKVTALIKSKDLGHPNGIAMGSGGSVWVASFGTGEIYEIDAQGTKHASTRPPKGQLDGIVLVDGGEAIVSSWEGKAIYKGKGTTWKELVSGVESPADFGFDTKRRRLLIPIFSRNAIELHSL
jgi:sugar lactone lactonase YvrE